MRVGISPSAEGRAEIWSEMDRIAAEIARDWPEEMSAAQAVSEDRREI